LASRDIILVGGGSLTSPGLIVYIEGPTDSFHQMGCIAQVADAVWISCNLTIIEGC